MHSSASFSRLFAIVAVIAFFIVGLAATGPWLASKAAGKRPAANSPVKVVKVPRAPAVDRLQPCPTCILGAPGRSL